MLATITRSTAWELVSDWAASGGVPGVARQSPIAKPQAWYARPPQAGSVRKAGL
jgi:hypothetical protein